MPAGYVRDWNNLVLFQLLTIDIWRDDKNSPRVAVRS